MTTPLGYSPALLADILGPDGLIVVVVVALVLLFGGAQLPKLARGLGSASHEFRKGLTEGEHTGAPDGSSQTPGQREPDPVPFGAQTNDSLHDQETERKDQQ